MAMGAASNSGSTLPQASLPPVLETHFRSGENGHASNGAHVSSNGYSNGNGRIASSAETHPIRPLAEVERHAIMEAIEYTKGDRAIAAHLLGIGRTTLYRKLKEYELAG